MAKKGGELGFRVTLLLWSTRPRAFFPGDRPALTFLWGIPRSRDVALRRGKIRAETTAPTGSAPRRGGEGSIKG